MATTGRLTLPFVLDAQASKLATIREALEALDALVQPSVKDRDLVVPPGSPAEGDAYLLPTGVSPAPSGAWAGQDGKIAYYANASWSFKTVREGFKLWVDDENITIVYDGSAWTTDGNTINVDGTAGVNRINAGSNMTSSVVGSVATLNATGAGSGGGGSGQTIKMLRTTISAGASSATIQIPDTEDYSKVILGKTYYKSMRPQTNNVSLRIKMIMEGGSLYATSNYHVQLGANISPDADNFVEGSTNNTDHIPKSTVGNGSDHDVSGFCELVSDQSADARPQTFLDFTAYLRQDNLMRVDWSGWFILTTNVFRGWQFDWSAGNFEDGELVMFYAVRA